LNLKFNASVAGDYVCGYGRCNGHQAGGHVPDFVSVSLDPGTCGLPVRAETEADNEPFDAEKSRQQPAVVRSRSSMDTTAVIRRSESGAKLWSEYMNRSICSSS
jgi:hypothetical protein